MSHLPMMDRLSAAAPAILSVMLEAAVKGATILLLVALLARLMRRTSAAARHLVWFLGVLSLLLLPMLSAALPGWRILPDLPGRDVLQAHAAGDAETIARADSNPPAAVPRDVSPVVESRAVHDDSNRLPARAEADRPIRASRSSDHPTVSSDSLPPAAVPNTSPTPAADSPNAVGPKTAAPKAIVLTLPRLDWRAWAVIVWSIASAALFAYMLLGYVSLWILRRRSIRTVTGEIPSLVRQLCVQLGIRRPVELLTSPRRTMPMTWGLWRIRLLMPVDFCAWSADEQRTVLLHELAHAKRWDCLTQLIAQLACAVYWFNPLVWLVWRRMQTERETACDDLVLNAGTRPSAYAEQLLRIAGEMPPARASAAIAIARTSKLESRLRAILDARRNRGKASIGVLVIVTLFIGIAAVGIAMLRAHNHAPNNAADIDPAMLPPAGFGRVVDAQGQPVAEAKIECEERKWSTVSGADGLFFMQNLLAPTPNGLPLEVRAPGFLDRRFHVRFDAEREPKERLIRMRRAGRLEGILLGRNGKPLAGAKVAASFHRGEIMDQFITYAGRDGTTNVRGEFTIDNVPPGDVMLFYPVNKSGPLAPEEFGVAEQLTLDDGQTVNGIVLDMSKSLCAAEGRVLDRDGKPLRGAKVHLIWKFPGGGSTYSVGAWPFDFALTDATGRFRLEKRPPGEWTVRASIGATAGAESVPIEFSATPAAVPDFVLPVVQVDNWVRRARPINIPDTVKEWAAAVLAGDQEGERLLENGGSPMWENGKRLLPLLKQSIEFTESTIDGESSGTGTYTTGKLDLGSGRRGKVTFELRKERQLWHLDDDGRIVYESDSKQPYWQITDAIDEDGVSLITGDAPKDDPPEGAGRVVDFQRRPIAGAKITSDTSDWTAETMADGTFIWQDVPSQYNVRVHAVGFLDRKAHMPDVRNRRVIHMQRGCRLEGRVLGEDGKPLPGVSVAIQNQPTYEGYSDWFHRGVKTDKHGQFVIDGVPPEKSLLRVRIGTKDGVWEAFGAADGADEGPGPGDQTTPSAFSAKVLTLTDGQVLRDVVLDLSKSTAVATGRVVDKNGAPIRGAVVHLVCELFPSNIETISDLDYATSGKDGRFRLTRTPPGQWLLTAKIRGGTSEPIAVSLSDKASAVGNLVVPVVQTASGWIRRVPPMDTFDTVRAWIEDSRGGDLEGAAALVVPGSPMQRGSDRLRSLLKQRLETRLNNGSWNDRSGTGTVWIEGVDLGGGHRAKASFHLKQSLGIWRISDVTDDKGASLVAPDGGAK